MALDQLTGIEEDDGAIFLTRYRIDPERYTAMGRSFTFMVREHMCKESRSQLGKPVEIRQPVKDPGSKKVRFELRTGTFGEDPVAVVAECCSRTPEFKNPDLPVKEIISRILLAAGNVEGPVKAGFGLGGEALLFASFPQLQLAPSPTRRCAFDTRHR